METTPAQDTKNIALEQSVEKIDAHLESIDLSLKKMSGRDKEEEALKDKEG